MRKITKRSAAILAVTAVAIGGGAAWAATSWFSGTGSADAASSSVNAVTATATVSGKLWPGQNRNAVVSVTNPNDYPVRVSGATITGIVVTGGDMNGNNPQCTTANSKISLGSVPANVVIPGKPANFENATPTPAGTFPEFIRMGVDASPACANATFAINFSLAGAVA